MNSEGLQQLDESISTLAAAVYGAYENQAWARLTYIAKFSPTADVWAGDYDLLLSDGTLNQGTLPDASTAYRIDKLAHRHWRLTQDLGQARWYRLRLTIERDGKYAVDLEYKDDYREGDIMERG